MDVDGEFDRELSLLRGQHSALEPCELDRIRGRVRARASRPRARAWGQLARSRVAVVAAIATGGLMSTGATALGVSGLAAGGNASFAQYVGAGASVPGAAPGGPTLPVTGTVALQGAAPGGAPSSVNGGAPSSVKPAPAGGPYQAPLQLGSTTSQGSAPAAGAPSSGAPEVTGSAPSTGAPKHARTKAVTPAERVAQSGPSTKGKLPFTGFAVIPMLLIGLALLVGGLLARRIEGRRVEDAPPS